MTSVQRCDTCSTDYDELAHLIGCSSCGGLLGVVHAGPDRAGAALRGALDTAWYADPLASGVWRYAELVLPTALPHAITHPEGNTPLLTRSSVNAWAGGSDIVLKHEGHNPTGSFKDRGMTVAVTQAVRTGATAVACASTGNTSASLAAYAAQAGIPALVFVPAGKVSTAKLDQTLAYGAEVIVVEADFDRCLALAREAADAFDIHLLNSINPFRIEGQKTIIFELLQQLRWAPPDVIAFPAGNLGNTAAFGKALDEAFGWGMIDRLPRLVAVQASGAAPFADAYRRDFASLIPVHAETVATAIRIGNPASYARAVRSIRRTNGIVLDVTDDELLEAKQVIDHAGIGCEPASAAGLAGVRRLRGDGMIAPDDTVAVIVTGHLLKDPRGGTSGDAESANRLPSAIPPTLAAVERRLRRVSA